MNKKHLLWGGLLMVPVVIIALPLLALLALMGGTSATAATTGGYGTGLRDGTVPAQYVQLVVQAGSLCPEAPPSIIAAQIQQESDWNPNAVSSTGAEGISQFEPYTWPTWSNPGESPFDPAAAIPAQGRFDCALAKQMAAAEAAGKLPTTIPVTNLMLAAYNAGAGAVLAAHGIPQNGQTPAYVTRITTNAANFADTTGTSPIVTATAFGARVVAYARTQLGQPYSFAGGSFTGPTLGVCGTGVEANACHVVGFDCSGLALYAVYQASGGRTKLSHSADAQTRGGTPVARANMQPGDLISFTNPGQTIAHHDAIYIGNNQIIHAPHTGTVVQISSLSGSYWASRTWRIVRYG